MQTQVTPIRGFGRNGGDVRTLEDKIQMAADVIGLIPVIGIPAEIVSGIISLRKKDYVGFGLSMLGMIPFEGDIAVAIKIAGAAGQAAQAVRPRAARGAHRTTRAREAGPAYSIVPAFNSRIPYAYAA